MSQILSLSLATLREFLLSLSFVENENHHFVHPDSRVYIIYKFPCVTTKEEALKLQNEIISLRKQDWKVRVIQQDIWEKKNDLIKWQISRSLLGLQTVFARDLEVHLIDDKIAFSFLEKYHLLGSTKGKYYFALSIPPHREFRFKKLGISGMVAVAVFGRTIIRNKVGFEGKKSIEWIRFATLPSIRIVGGITKVFNYLYNLDAYDDIMTYVDIESNDAKGLESIGFQMEEIMDPMALIHGYNLGNYKLRYARS